MDMGEGMPAVSVIIPMYNVAKYIGFAMDSLAKQKFQDFEIILIDDASTDGTYEICQRNYGNSEQIRILKNDVNSGQWFARNRGIEEAAGKYIYFLDADDELLPNALEVMYHTAETEKADVVHDNMYFMAYTEGRMLPRKALWEGCSGGDVTEGRLPGSRVDRMRWQWTKTMSMPWLHLYRRDFLLEQNIRFVNLPYGEDNVFSLLVALKAENYVRISKMLYLYRGYTRQKERMVAKLPKAFVTAVNNLDELNKIFDECSEEELPFEDRMGFIAPWLRAHLRFCVFDIMDMGKKQSIQTVAKYMEAAAGKGNLLAAYMLHLLGDYTHERQAVLSKRAEQRARFAKFFAELDQGSSKHDIDPAYIQSQALRAVEVEDGETAYYLKAYAYLGRSSVRLGQYKEAMEAYGRALEFAETGSTEYVQMAAEKIAVLPLLDCSSEELQRKYGAYTALLEGLEPLAMESRKGRGKGRIRLGVLADEFDGSFFGIYYGLLFCMDKDRFEIFCYHRGKKRDPYTVYIRESMAGFIAVDGLSYRETAARIRADGVDVLIDLAGGGQDSLPVLALRPAPLQLRSLECLAFGKFNWVDGFLADEVVSALSEGDLEKSMIKLPSCYSYAMRSDLPPSREVPSMVKGYVTYVVFASYSLINDTMLTLWKEILDQVPQGRLLLKGEDFAVQAMVVEAAERLYAMGFDMERVSFEGNRGDPVASLLDVDILLGTYPLIEAGKLLDALYMGVPAVLLYGDRPDTRLGLSILSRLGMEGLATAYGNEYVHKAVSLAGNSYLLEYMHKNLRETVEAAAEFSPLKWAKALEAAIEDLAI